MFNLKIIAIFAIMIVQNIAFAEEPEFDWRKTSATGVHCVAVNPKTKEIIPGIQGPNIGKCFNIPMPIRYEWGVLEGEVVCKSFYLPDNSYLRRTSDTNCFYDVLQYSTSYKWHKDVEGNKSCFHFFKSEAEGSSEIVLNNGKSVHDLYCLVKDIKDELFGQDDSGREINNKDDLGPAFKENDLETAGAVNT